MSCAKLLEKTRTTNNEQKSITEDCCPISPASGLLVNTLAIVPVRSEAAASVDVLERGESQ